MYRVVVADLESPQRGDFLENIGHYNPRSEPPTIVIDEKRSLYWLSQGAQPSETVARMLKKLGIMDEFQRQKSGVPIEGETGNGG